MNIQHPTSNIEHPILRRVRSANIYALVTIISAAGITRADEEKSKRYSRELPATHPQADKVRAKIEELIIPKVEFRENSVREAIDYLRRHGVRRDGLGVNLVMSLGSEPPPISLKLENVNYLKALDAICVKAGLFWKIRTHNIVVGSRDNVSGSAE